MKKKYLLNLDEEKVDEIKAWLEKRGVSSFSSYMNTLIDEQIEAIKMFAPEGDISRVTQKNLIKMAGKMATKLSKELKK